MTAEIGELKERLAHYPVDRYPMQHATACFHLGVALTNAGRPGDAEPVLAAAMRLFGSAELGTEQAKAANALGAARRMAGRPAEAAHCFRLAAEAFAAGGCAREQGAALFNLGLVTGDLGADPLELFEQARALLPARELPAYAAAVARETGAARLARGEVEAARAALQEARELAGTAADLSGFGAASNLLGLVHLAAGRFAEAVAAFRDACGAHPRSVRPAEFAMAKANLALAYEHTGDTPRARLAAGQALAVTAAPVPVHDQATAVLDRIGRPLGALLDVLDVEPAERWPVVLREELLVWAEAPEGGSASAARAWVAGVLARPRAGPELVAAWLGAVLELPPEAMATAVDVLLGSEDVELLRPLVSRAMARFPIPQWQRLAATFDRLAAEHRLAGSWG